MTKRRPSQRHSVRQKTSDSARQGTTRRTPRTRRSKTHTQEPGEGAWPTAITRIERNKILVRGYPLDEMMGRVSFGEAICLVLTGELPSPDVGRLIEALLVSAVDHGATPPSTLAARNVATTGAPVRAATAAGVLAFGSPLGGGGSIDGCFRFLEDGLNLVGEWVSYDDAARRMVDQCLEQAHTPPGFGHRFHTRDPRARRLLQIALELELEGRRVQLLRSVERVLVERCAASGDPPLPINIDGAIAAVCGDLGFDAETANVLFMVSRIPGLVAHAIEEQRRQPPMRQIDPTNHTYDGPGERRLPETRR